jgi:hypothetical protein
MLRMAANVSIEDTKKSDFAKSYLFKKNSIEKCLNQADEFKFSDINI